MVGEILGTTNLLLLLLYLAIVLIAAQLVKRGEIREKFKGEKTNKKKTMRKREEGSGEF